MSSESFGDVLAYGGGVVEFRVRIEGCPLEFCTTHAMAGVRTGDGFDGATVAGVRRVGGLARAGLSFTESVYIPGADYKASVGSVTVEDADTSVAWNLRAASWALGKIPRVVGYLTQTATAGDSILYVNAASAFTVGRVYHIGTEAFRYEVEDDGGLQVTRAMWGTTAQAHFVSASTLVGDVTQIAPIYDAVPTYRRRRVWIYAHGHDSFGIEDTGTLVFRGVISGTPQLTDGATWSFSIAPLSSVLDADIGPREGASALRGIYYPGEAPLRIQFYQWATSERMSSIDGTATVVLSGFWEDNASFCAALNAEIAADATISGWSGRFSARPVGERWELFYRTGGSGTQRYASVRCSTSVDGTLFERSDPLYTLAGTSTDDVTFDTEYVFAWRADTVPSTGYAHPVDGLRKTPRAQFFAYDGVPGDTAAQIALYPWSRAYLASVAGMQAGDIIRMDRPAFGDSEALAWEATLTDVDTADGFVEWDPDTMRRIDAESGETVGVGGIWTSATPAAEPEIVIARDYGDGVSFADFLEAVWTDAPDSANGGVVPFVLESDFAPIADIRAAVEEAAAGAPWLLRRAYRFSTAVSFSDVVKHECRLAGLFMATTSSGAITFRPVTTRLAQDDTITTADLVNDDSVGELVTEPDGVLTGMTLRTGYDSREDEHKGRTHEVTILDALARHRKRTALEVAPKSRASGAEPDHVDLIRHVFGTIRLWSAHRVQASFDVTIAHYDTLVGDCVRVTVPQLPYDGERSIDGGGGGMLALRGTVVGRSWTLADPAVTLTVLFDSLDVAGYTPTGRVTSESGSGTSWTVTLDADEYGPGGSVADASFFVAGMRVRLIEWDNDSPTIVTGAVVSVSGNDVALTTDSTWTPGASTWNLLYDQADTSGMTTTQLEQALVGGTDLRVTLASGSQASKMMAP